MYDNKNKRAPEVRSLFDLCRRSLRCVRSNICSEATGPLVAKFIVEPLLVGEMQDCTNCPGHVTNMVALRSSFPYQKADDLQT